MPSFQNSSTIRPTHPANFVFLQKIETPFLEAVKETLEDRYTENMEVIYKITIKLILEHLVAGYHEGSKMLEEGKPLPTREQVMANIG